MARADLIVDLVDAQRKGDDSRFRVLVEAIIAEERGKQHHLLADRLTQLITSTGSSALLARDDSARPVADLLHEVVPRRRLADLQLDDHTEAFAAETMVPFYVVRYEGVVSSFLGETTGRLDHVFEFARTRRCVLFFDEFDTLAKERSDTHETGEIKRVVSTLLLQIDRLPSHVLVVCATNHAELLDRAAWRRFQVRLHLRSPSRSEATDFFQTLTARKGDLGLAPRTLADRLAGASYAELEQFADDVRRRYVLSLPDGRLSMIAQSRLAQWRAQARE
jgi:hypothetical protein